MSTTTDLPIPAIERLEAVGGALLRYGLVLFLVWFGAFKFTAAEARAIEPLVANSPFMSWMYAVASPRAVSGFIGVSELVVAALIALRPLSATASAAGSLAAIGIFVVTLSFLATTPGSWAVVDGFPIPAGAGGFVVKDLFLLGAAVWSAGEAWRARTSEARS
jgi:uncharacterized membrane protein YkgB